MATLPDIPPSVWHTFSLRLTELTLFPRRYKCGNWSSQVEQVCQGHRASQQWSWGLSSGSLNPTTVLFPRLPPSFQETSRSLIQSLSSNKFHPPPTISLGLSCSGCVTWASPSLPPYITSSEKWAGSKDSRRPGKTSPAFSEADVVFSAAPFFPEEKAFSLLASRELISLKCS